MRLKQPEAQAMLSRQEEMRARREAAASLFPAPPSIGLSQRTDRYNQNRGDRETEVEISVPLWMPGTKNAAQRLVQAESNALEARHLVRKLKVAAEVREAYWQARIAHNDHHLATHHASEAAELMNDVERRFKAGELARTDFNKARFAERSARTNLAEAEARAIRTMQAFTALTGLQNLPEAGEEMKGLAHESRLAGEVPEVALLAAAIQLQQAKLAHVSAERREPPKVAVGVVRERPAYAADHDNSIKFSVHIPLATESRNAPRIAAANADLAEAEAALALKRDQLQAEITSLKAELTQAQKMEVLARERYEFAADTHALHEKAFRLGELDLPTRLRSENELFEADLALSRAQLETGPPSHD